MASKQQSNRTPFDPLATFCFALSIDDIIDEKNAFFKSVSGLKSESEVVSYAEGGLNNATRQLVGPTKWPNLVLKRGFTNNANNDKLILWRQAWLGNKKLVRHNGQIIQLSRELKPVCRWHFIAGWPCKWEGPEYDASKSELAVETLEIAHEGLVYQKG